MTIIPSINNPPSIMYYFPFSAQNALKFQKYRTMYEYQPTSIPTSIAIHHLQTLPPRLTSRTTTSEIDPFTAINHIAFRLLKALEVPKNAMNILGLSYSTLQLLTKEFPNLLNQENLAFHGELHPFSKKASSHAFELKYRRINALEDLKIQFKSVAAMKRTEDTKNGRKNGRKNGNMTDCVRAEPVIHEKLSASEKDVALLRAYAVDRPTWRNPSHPWRMDPKFKLMGVPTLIRWENDDVVGRLEDYEAHVGSKIESLLNIN